MNAVETHDVVHTFDDVTALNGVSISFPEGIVYGLLGPNGAGKTTLIRVLATLLKPDSGTALVVGLDAINDPVSVRHKIGLAGQSAAVDGFLTGRENIEMVGQLYNLSRKEASKRASEVLERIHLTEAADRPVRTYSGGMRKRLDLAASIVGRPEVLFLDEPTTGVDPVSRLDLWEMIEELVDGGTTLLLTTQYLDEADRLADRIGVIDHGLLIEEGSSDELKDRLGGSVIEVSVSGDDRGSAAAALTQVGGGEIRTEGQRLLIPAADGARSLTAAVRALDDADVVPFDIGLRRPTLDDVFLALTGHATEEENTPTPPSKKRGRRR